MPHDISLISTITAGFVLAFVLGFLAVRVNLPPLIGYLVAGIMVGPNFPGFVGNSSLAVQLAEIGVMLLMFGVGLHFSLDDLLAVRRIAIPGALGQIAIATVLGMGLAFLWGWPLGQALVLGLCLSVASTVVLLKALEERNAIMTPKGRIAVGWLIVEDLAMIGSLVVLPALATALGGTSHAAHPPGEAGGNLWADLLITFLKVGGFVAMALTVGPRVLPFILHQVARTGSRELFTLATLALALGIAYASAALFGVSYALGAFFAGLILSESDLSHKTAEKALPLQDAFAVLFFISVGMQFDPAILIEEPGKIMAVLLLVLIGKSLAALGIVVFLGFPISTALMISAALAQVGEFSFILAGLGMEYGLCSETGMNLILAAAILSIALNPACFWVAGRLSRLVESKEALHHRLESSRQGRIQQLERELEEVRRRSAKKEHRNHILTPEELGERFPLFSGMSHDQREILLLNFEVKTAQPGDRIIRSGDKANEAFFITSGEVEVSVGGRTTRLGPGDTFGEMALLSHQPRNADVTAIDYCEFLSLNRKDFNRFLGKVPQTRGDLEALARQRQERNHSSTPNLGSAQ